MRNIIEYPVTIPEMVETLKRISADLLEKQKEEASCGNMDSYVLTVAADLLESLENEFNAMGLTTNVVPEVSEITEDKS